MNQHYYFCSLCKSNQRYLTFLNLYKHIRLVHRKDQPFRVCCKLDLACGSVYNTFSSYRSHLNKYHRSLLSISSNTTILINPDDNIDVPCLFPDHNAIKNPVDNEFLSSSNDLDVGEDVSMEFMESNSIDIDWPFLSHSFNITDSIEKIGIHSFEKYYTKFLLELREYHLLPQCIIQSITSYFLSLLCIIEKIIESRANTSDRSGISLEDVRFLFRHLNKLIGDTGKNDYQFLKRCEKYFGYSSPTEVKLNEDGDYGYYIPIELTLKNLFEKMDVIDALVKNINETGAKAKTDPDLMLTYRHGVSAVDNPSLQSHPEAFLIQLYIDDVGVTNPIGPRKDEHKLTLLYFLLEDLPQIVRSLLQSIGVLGICYSKDLSIRENQVNYFQHIVKDLNSLQEKGIGVKTFNGHLFFAFTLLAADNLASNDIGGFQRNFNSGSFCRSCFISYEFKTISLIDVSFVPRTIKKHDKLVEAILASRNRRSIRGVTGKSVLSELIGFHAVKSLPNDIMHDFAEGKKQKNTNVADIHLH